MLRNKHPRDAAIMQDTVRLDLKHSLDMVRGYRDCL